MKSTLYALIVGSVSFLTLSVKGDVKLPHVFSDHMVIQRGMAIPVWGTASPGESVSVLLKGKTSRVVANQQGRWAVKLPAAEAGGPYILEIRGTNRLVITDVLIGEVWFASGQSNMQMELKKIAHAEQEISGADFPQIRMFTAKNVVAAEPCEDVDGKWLVSTPAVAGGFSALGFLFARELHEKLSVPVGIVHVSCGWTPAESWTSREALAADPELNRDIVKRWDDIISAYKNANPKPPVSPNALHRSSGLWNGAIAPLVSYAIRGVIWYQGETNDQRGYQYRRLFPILIEDWRKKWCNPKMPFLYVQLANVLPPDPEPRESEWAEVREAQFMTLRLPHTGMAVTLDIGEEKDVHPKNKQEVASRLVRIALAEAYGEKIEDSGPLYRTFRIEGSSVRISFDHVNQGLTTPEDAPLRGFALSGADRRFVPADARIEEDGVVVSSPAVTQPVAVRYAWANNPVGANLYSRTRDGVLLPASSFRTDEWPGKSYGVVKLPMDP